MNSIEIKPIGVIYTSHKEVENMPIQPIAAEGIKGYIELLPEYADGLKDIEGFSHITLVYYFHKIKSYELKLFLLWIPKNTESLRVSHQSGLMQ